MGKWKIILEGVKEESDDDLELEMDDISLIFGGYVGFKTKHFEELMDLVESSEKYSAIRNIKSITPPTNEQVPIEGIVLVLCTDEEELNYGILLLVTQEDTIILGVWPEPFYEAIKEKNEILNNVIAAIIEGSDIMKRVDVVFPL